MRSLLALLVFLLVSFLPALTGLVWTPGEWFRSLDKPPWNPPAWIFGPVWTLLYALMGIAAWLAWTSGDGSRRRLALALFAAQLAFNALWTPVFFGLHRPGAALGVIGILLVLIVLTLVAFWRLRPLAGALLIPYLIWVGFATVLNASLWLRNP